MNELKLNHCVVNLGAKFNFWRKNGEFCDVEFIPADCDTPIPCHKLVLMAASNYFYKMFCGGMIESQNKTVKLHDINYSALSSLIDFIYIGHGNMDGGNIFQLTAWAQRLDIQPLEYKCHTFLMNCVDSQNAIYIYDFAKVHVMTSLQKKSSEFIRGNFEEIVSKEEWLSTSKETLIEIISSDRLKVTNEDKVLEALLKWTAQNPEHNDILKYVRIDFLTQDAIHKSLNYLEPYLSTKSRSPRNYIARHFHLLLQSAECLNNLHVLCCAPDDKGVEIYRQPELLINERLCCLANMADGTMYASTKDIKLFKYNHTTRSLIGGGPMRLNCQIMDLTICEDVIYAILRRIGFDPITSLEIFLPQCARWKIFSRLDDQYERVIAHGSTIYLMSKKGNLVSANAQCGKLAEPPITDWIDAEACSLLSQGKLLVHGCSEIEFTTLEYDTRLDEWTTLCTMTSTNIANFKIFASDERAYLVEETNLFDRETQVWILDSSTERWEKLCVIPREYGHFIGHVLRNRCSMKKSIVDEYKLDTTLTKNSPQGSGLL